MPSSRFQPNSFAKSCQVLCVAQRLHRETQEATAKKLGSPATRAAYLPARTNEGWLATIMGIDRPDSFRNGWHRRI